MRKDEAFNSHYNQQIKKIKAAFALCLFKMSNNTNARQLVNKYIFKPLFPQFIKHKDQILSALTKELLKSHKSIVANYSAGNHRQKLLCFLYFSFVKDAINERLYYRVTGDTINEFAKKIKLTGAELRFLNRAIKINYQGSENYFNVVCLSALALSFVAEMYYISITDESNYHGFSDVLLDSASWGVVTAIIIIAAYTYSKSINAQVNCQPIDIREIGFQFNQTDTAFLDKELDKLNELTEVKNTDIKEEKNHDLEHQSLSTLFVKKITVNQTDNKSRGEADTSGSSGEASISPGR